GWLSRPVRVLSSPLSNSCLPVLKCHAAVHVIRSRELLSQSAGRLKIISREPASPLVLAGPKDQKASGILTDEEPQEFHCVHLPARCSREAINFCKVSSRKRITRFLAPCLTTTPGSAPES